MDKDFVLRVLRKVGLNNPDFIDIDPYLLLLIFKSSHKMDSNDMMKIINEYYIMQYGKSDNQRLEFLGDRVLDLAISEKIYSIYNINSSNALTYIKSIIVRNETLDQIGKQLGLCRSHLKDKASADLVEALIGALYLHLTNKKFPGAYEYIRNWIYNYFQIDSLLDYLLEETCRLTNIPVALMPHKARSLEMKTSYQPEYSDDYLLNYIQGPGVFDYALKLISKLYNSELTSQSVASQSLTSPLKSIKNRPCQEPVDLSTEPELVVASE